MVKYCINVRENQQKTVCAKGADHRIHFKNTFEVGTVIRGQNLLKARQYLQDVMDRKRCVPFLRYSNNCGRTAQAKEFKVSTGRWPVKSVQAFLGLLQNIESNAIAKNLNVEDLVISHVAVQRAMKGRRRTYRGFGRISPCMSNPCHIEILCKLKEDMVAKPKADGEHKTIHLSKKKNAARRLRVGA